MEKHGRSLAAKTTPKVHGRYTSAFCPKTRHYTNGRYVADDGRQRSYRVVCRATPSHIQVGIVLHFFSFLFFLQNVSSDGRQLRPLYTHQEQLKADGRLYPPRHVYAIMSGKVGEALGARRERTHVFSEYSRMHDNEHSAVTSGKAQAVMTFTRETATQDQLTCCRCSETSWRSLIPAEQAVPTQTRSTAMQGMTIFDIMAEDAITSP